MAESEPEVIYQLCIERRSILPLHRTSERRQLQVISDAVPQRLGVIDNTQVEITQTDKHASRSRTSN